MTSPSAKALAGLAEGKVRPAVAPVRQYHVESASHPGVIYQCFVGAHTTVCTCEHARRISPTRCWHLDAAVARDNASRLELSVMDEAIELAKARERATGESTFARLV